MIKERLSRLREEMKREGIDCYLIPTSDYHNSEYVSDFFKVRKYFSGFTGSAGTLVVSMQEAALFTDGRYFIQAEGQLRGSGIRLMKIGEPDVPTIKQYLEQILEEGQCLGFDGRVVMAHDGEEYEKITGRKQGRIAWEKDLADAVWLERPALEHHPVYLLEERYSGESAADKISRVREKMQEAGAELHVITTLDDIAWLLNLRGKDVESCPVFFAYLVLARDEILLFSEVQEEMHCYLKQAGVTPRPYKEFYSYLAGIHGKKVLLSTQNTNYRLHKELAADVEILDKPNPTTLMKAVKNPTEMENLRKSHLKDGIAVTRFMYWLKKNTGKIPMSEISAAEYLEGLRGSMEHYLEPSFGTICAYGPNAALAHYSATPEHNSEIRAQGFLLVDSGGHYLEGSTDITRTFVLGELSEEMRRHFTLVLRAVLRLKNTRFLYGCSGLNLDIRAREVFWEEGLDYRHGTGHGVGYLLSVHEGPNSFRWKPLPDYQNLAVLEEGMVTTDEPGIYIEGSHGIRLENELLCRKGEQTEYGQFMYFEDLTCVPFDLDGVDGTLLGDRERTWLNQYHREVYERLSPYFEGEELEWLGEVTRAI